MTVLTGKNEWNAPSQDSKLLSNDVHIWRASLEVQSEHLRYLHSILSDEEILRAKRFHFERDRNHYIVARGLLRVILNRYLKIGPKELEFSYNRFGKPGLKIMRRENILHFNLSHSGQLVLYAIASGRKVGLDIECIRPFGNSEQIVERFFSDKEKEEFSTLPEGLKEEAFFTCWTRKEAYIKAIGEGLSHPLNQFSVSLTPGEPARLMHTQKKFNEEDTWFLKEIMPGPGYIAALVTERDNLFPRCWQWFWSNEIIANVRALQ